MAFKGTTSRPTPQLIANLIDGIGGESNAFTSKEYTGYYIKSANTHVDFSLDMLSDMLQHSLLKQEEIDKERGVIIEELNMYEDTPMRKLGDIYEELLYGDTPMGWDTVGTKETLQAMQREDFVDYMQSFYSADQITVVVTGGIEQQKTLDLVTKFFGSMPKFATKGYEKIVENQTKPAVLIKQKETEQAHLALGVRGIALRHPDEYPLEVLGSILGSGFSSRMFQEVREKRGLAYYIGTSSDNNIDSGNFTTTAGVDPKRIDEAIKAILEQYNVIRSNPVPEEELKKAKELIKGHFVLALEDSRSVASFFAHQEIQENQIDTPAEVIEKIDKVTAEDVNRVAKQYLVNETLNLAVIGNFTDRQHFEDLLKL
jgi:predicted Zn-dependent peptidase